MENYHKHTCASNIFTPDSPATYDQYAKRAVEIGHKTLCSLEHGWQGKYHECREVALKYGLKFIFGTEAYWVLDRHEKDKTNSHIVLLAKNENGRQSINEVLSTANEDGYYYRPRLDLELLLSLPASDVFVTSACVAFWKYENINEIVEKLHEHFKDNFMLEIQPHNTDKQKALNRRILGLHHETGIQMIVGLDSHYIYPDQSVERDELLAASETHYEDEDGWYMDYPDDETVLQRFLEQGVIPKDLILQAMKNTEIVRTFDDYESEVFETNRKLPSIYPDKTPEEKYRIYNRLISKKFKEYMKTVPPEEYQKYFDGVQMEVHTYRDTGMVDYPLLDYEIVKKGLEYGGIITSTGRGCFTKEALVHTDKGLKQICDVKIGDRVIDMNGQFKTVLDTMSYSIHEDLIEISYVYGVVGGHPNICTLDHKILILRNDKIEWIKAKDIAIGDYVCLPRIKFNNAELNIIDLNDYNDFGYDFDDDYIYEYSPFVNNQYDFSPRELSRKFHVSKKIMEDFANGKKDIFSRKPNLLKNIMDYVPFSSVREYREYIKGKRTIKIPRFIYLDYEFGQFIGMMYGDGCNPEGRNEFSLALNRETHKGTINRKVFHNIVSKMGLRVKTYKSQNKNLDILTARSKIISNFISKFLFVSSKGKEKQFNPFLFNTAKEVRDGILNGLTLSDGSISSGRISFDNTSLSLIGAFKLLSLDTENGIMGLTVRQSRIDCRGYKQKKSFKLRCAINPYYCGKTSERCKKDENYFYLPIKQTKILKDQTTTVYDLTVEDSHSYLLNNMIVHNSAVGYFTNTLCGFSKVDRFKSPIPLYPERFLSKTRIIETNSLPD